MLEALLSRIENPDAGHALIAEIGEEYTKKKKTFLKKAAEHAAKHALKR